ncbi:hypothetical protein [Pelomicrobium sp. G1]|uniref:hypothetical protein n=1 Tax=unclassified Pelomicrobium TaxID=2815318 RepID=UPI003F77101D
MLPPRTADGVLPLSVLLRFFLTAPTFALLAAVVIATKGPAAAASRWTPAALAATHLMTLGFVTMTAAGALLQILPVAAGAPVARGRLVAEVAHGALTVGTLLLAWTFLGGVPLLAPFGAAALLAGLGVYVAAAAQAILRAPVATPTGVTVGFALASLAVTVLMGATLAVVPVPFAAVPRPALVDLHLAWGFAGWIGLLVAGVAYQVVPMFGLTKPYPKLVHRGLAPAVVGALVSMSAAALAGGAAVGRFFYGLAGAGILTAFAAFLLVTLKIQSGGRRRGDGATAAAWRLAMLALGASLLGAGVSLATDATHGRPIAVMAAVAFLFGFAFWMIAGMLYRIVPFLAWIDLQGLASHARPLPSARQLAPQGSCLAHVWAHAAALALLVAAVDRPALASAAGVGFGISALWLGLNLLGSVRLYRRAKQDLSRGHG